MCDAQEGFPATSFTLPAHASDLMWLLLSLLLFSLLHYALRGDNQDWRVFIFFIELICIIPLSRMDRRYFRGKLMCANVNMLQMKWKWKLQARRDGEAKHAPGKVNALPWLDEMCLRLATHSQRERLHEVPAARRKGICTPPVSSETLLLFGHTWCRRHRCH